MLTKIHVKNFRKLSDVEIELGRSVVLIGPNNSGKTAALQALALWEVGLREWNEKKSRKSPKKRSGIAVNRKDLISIPVPTVDLLWKDLRTRNVTMENGKPNTQNVRIDIIVDGILKGNSWSCGLEFDYANVESLYCRPLRLNDSKTPPRMPIPQEASEVRVAFLPPMSGLADREFSKKHGEIEVLIGQGQTAQVLRNLCYQVYKEKVKEWDNLCLYIKQLFGVELLHPNYSEHDEITLSYKELNGNKLDISASGRGLQQTLLLLAHLYANPGTLLLLDEPDAHLEVLRQRQTYNLLTEIADKQNSQIIAASHSEIVLDEAAGRDIVIAFVGKPHRIDDRGSQLLKALKEIGFDQYYQAEQTGWVLYLEGSTDLAILQTFAKKLDHKAAKLLERPFVYYVGNKPQKSRDHFFGLQEAYPNLVGIAIFDNLDAPLQNTPKLKELMWQKKEIENYFCRKDVLLTYAQGEMSDDLFEHADAKHRKEIIEKCIEEVNSALKTLGKPDGFSHETKVTDDFLDPLFREYFKKLNTEQLFWKNDYHKLAELVPKNEIGPEIIQKLDAIAEVAGRAKPKED